MKRSTQWPSSWNLASVAAPTSLVSGLPTAMPNASRVAAATKRQVASLVSNWWMVGHNLVGDSLVGIVYRKSQGAISTVDGTGASLLKALRNHVARL